MMTPERVTVAFVQEQMKEYYDHLIELDPDAVEFDENFITQGLVDEMNADIEGVDPNSPKREGSATSYVPRSIWQVLADEDIVDDAGEEDFIDWYEKHNS